MSDIVKEAGKKYLIQLQAHPLITKSITAGVLGGCIDIITQKISGVKKIQLRRLILLVLYGSVYATPLNHFLHKLLDKMFRKKDNNTAVKMMAVEQFVSSPLNNLSFMMYYSLVVEGRPWSMVKDKIRSDFPKIQLASWKFWPIIGWVNHRYIPLHLRILFQGFVGASWAIFLSLKARSAAATIKQA